MRPFGKIDGAALGPNPLTAPEDVTDDLLLEMPAHAARKTERWANRLGLFTQLADGSQAAGNVTVEVYALNESASVVSGGDARVFRLLGAALVLSNSSYSELVESGGNHHVFPPPGKIYLRVTVGNAAGLQVHAVIG